MPQTDTASGTDISRDEQGSGMKLCSWAEEELLLLGLELSSSPWSSDCRSKAAANSDLGLSTVDCAAV